MRKLSVTIPLAAVLVVAPFVQTQSKTEPALNTLTAAFAAAYNARDAAKVASFYADDAVVMPPNEPMQKGRSAIEARLKKEMKEASVTLALTPTESAIMGDRAYEVGTVTVTIAGRKTIEKYVVVYKRVGSEWKIAYDIWNGDAPPAPQK